MIILATSQNHSSLGIRNQPIEAGFLLGSVGFLTGAFSMEELL